MKTSSRLIVTAAVAGAAVLLPLTAAAPAFADGIATDETLTISASASTVTTGDEASYSISLRENAGGDPAGMTGRLVVDITRNGTTTSRVEAVNTQNLIESDTFDTTATGISTITATFVPKTTNLTFHTASTTITVLGKAVIAVTSDTVNAGDSIAATVGELRGSDGADGKLEATAPGLTLSACGPTPTNTAQSGCSIPVPKSTPSGTYPVTFTFSGSPTYANATVTVPITIVGTAASATNSGTGTPTGTSTSGQTTADSTGSNSTRSNSTVGAGQTVSGAAAGTVAGNAGSAATAGTTAGAPVPNTTDGASAQPTAVAAPLPGALGAGVPATVATAAGFSFLPIVIGAAGAGLVLLLVTALVIILVVRKSRRRVA